MKGNNIPAWVTSALTTILGATSVEEVTRVVLLIVGIISGLFSLAYNIYCWYKKAKEDGKITSDEIKEGVKIIDEGVKDIHEKTKGDN